MKKDGPSMSKSALLLSPCLHWAHPNVKWYDEKKTDTKDRDIGIEFHRLIDDYIRGNSVREKPASPATES